MQKSSAETANPTTLEIVSSSKFGRVPKISLEKRFNFFVADGFLINFAGYKFTLSLLANGRGIFSSKRSNLLFVVSERKFYRISPDFTPIVEMTLATDSGDIFIDEDILGNIGFCDGTNVYIYNWINGTKYVAGRTHTDILDFVPNYICFHNGAFLVTSGQSGGNPIGQWRISSTQTVDNVTYVIFPATAQYQGGFQTKPDSPIAICRLPGRENQIIVMGKIVTEVWNDLGLARFRYQRNSTFNIDYGCLNPATVASLDEIVVWLGINEQSGPVIMYTTGQDIKKISTDGINSLMESLQFPETCYGFLIEISGHLFYVITFYAQEDNVSIAYDFKEDKFYNLCDENLNYFIAKKTVFFQNSYYFVSINDGSIYQLNSNFDTYEYQNNVIKEIPRVIITNTMRTPNGSARVMNELSFIVEQGVDSANTGQGNNVSDIDLISGGEDYTECTALIEGDGQGAYATVTIEDGVVTDVTLIDSGVGYSWAVLTLIGDGTGAFANVSLNVNNYVPRVDLSISYDGGYTWSNFDQMQLTRYGNRKNKFYYNDLGYGNEFTLQFRVWCKSRFICSNGEVSFFS